MIDIAPDATGIDPDSTSRRVDRGAAKATEVDDEGVVPNPKTAAMVATAANGERQHAVASVGDACHDVGDIGAPHNRERVSINCAVVDGPRRVVLRIGSGDDLASDSGKIIDG